MQHTARIEANTALLSLMAEFETYDGAIDPAFDNDLDELERQFAEIRLIHASDLN
jgi:hypothetical protein